MILGVGVNDADYNTRPYVDGKRVWCPYYRSWYNMLLRCYSEVFQKDNPTYIGCIVENEWHSFVRFKSWMEGQDWKGNHLDKDLIVPGNKVYGPKFCIFIPKHVNTFLSVKRKKDNLPEGVHRTSKGNGYKFQTQLGGKHIGYFDTAEEAHSRYVEEKRSVAIVLAGDLGGKVGDLLKIRFSGGK